MRKKRNKYSYSVKQMNYAHWVPEPKITLEDCMKTRNLQLLKNSKLYLDGKTYYYDKGDNNIYTCHLGFLSPEPAPMDISIRLRRENNLKEWTS
jgi:hypothetical protein